MWSYRWEPAWCWPWVIATAGLSQREGKTASAGGIFGGRNGHNRHGAFDLEQRSLVHLTQPHPWLNNTRAVNCPNQTPVRYSSGFRSGPSLNGKWCLFLLSPQWCDIPISTGQAEETVEARSHHSWSASWSGEGFSCLSTPVSSSAPVDAAAGFYQGIEF